MRQFLLGLQIYTLRQDTVDGKHGLTQVLKQNKNLQDDLYDALTPTNLVVKDTSTAIFEQGIL